MDKAKAKKLIELLEEWRLHAERAKVLCVRVEEELRIYVEKTEE